MLVTKTSVEKTTISVLTHEDEFTDAVFTKISEMDTRN